MPVSRPGLTKMAHSGTLPGTMLKMRLQRIGRKNQPSFRVVVTDSRNAAKRGKNIDLLGSYEPKSGAFKIDTAKAKEWIAKGVQVSDTMHNFLVTEKVIEGKKKNVLSKKSPIIDEAKLKAEAEAKAKAEADAKAVADKVKEVNGEAGEAGLGHDEVGEGALGQAPAEPEVAPAADAPAEPVAEAAEVPAEATPEEAK